MSGSASTPGRRQALARVVDPAELDAATAKRARASLSLPEGWLGEPSRIRFVVPRRLRCDACEGGGCAGCDNRGGFVVPEELDRTVSLSLSGGLDGARVRVVPSFATCAGFDVLLVDIRRGEATLGAQRIDVALTGSEAARSSADPKLLLVVVLSLALLVAAAVAALR
jgi:hypothetical protein